MAINKKKQSSKDKRILIASIIVAGTIIAGSTFAWFTSKDEVTNRLSANADYGVSITETFTPPSEWLPGQDVNKDVSVINTGNIDAFVRVWLESELSLLSSDHNGTDILDDFTDVQALDDVTDPKLVNAQLVPTTENAKTYLRVLNADESKALQSGGWLAYAPAGCEWQYTDADNHKVTATDDDTVNSDIKVAAGTYGSEVNSATFKPKTTGLYLFRRGIDLQDDGTPKTVGYSGYYYVAGNGFGDGTYYALNTFEEVTEGNVLDSVYAAILDVGTTTAIYTPNAESSAKADITKGESTNLGVNSTVDKLSAADVAKIKLFFASSQLIENNNLNWTYKEETEEVGGEETVTAKYFEVTATNAPGFKIIVNLVKDNVTTSGGTADLWQKIDNTFYYTNDLESGSTSSQLVDSVKLDDSVTALDYISFDFDLNVNMDSIQITLDGEKETYDAVKTAWAVADGDNATAAKVSTADYSGNEIAALTWAK